MSKRDFKGSPLTIVLSPAPYGIGRFETRLDGNDGVLCVSRTPFFDAARKLVADGNDTRSWLIMRHAGSDTDSLRAKLETAASLAVEETDYGPKLRRWKPFSTLAVSPAIASDEPMAVTRIAPRDRPTEGSETGCPKRPL